MAKHREGPWCIFEREPGAEILLKRRHWQIGDNTSKRGIAFVFGDDDSHARLIAAAPDLLEMVRRYASECAECNGGGEIGIGREPDGTASEIVDCDSCADIRAMIAKAGC